MNEDVGVSLSDMLMNDRDGGWLFSALLLRAAVLQPLCAGVLTAAIRTLKPEVPVPSPIRERKGYPLL